MSVKELTELTLTDLMKEYKSLWNYWQGHDEAVKEFKKIRGGGYESKVIPRYQQRMEEEEVTEFLLLSF